MATIAGPKVEMPPAVSEMFNFRYDSDGKVIGASLVPEWAAFFNATQQTLYNGSRSGPTASRPTSTLPGRYVGMEYFDTTLGVPVFLKTASTDVWVDSSGSASSSASIGYPITSDTSSQADSDPGAGKFRWNNATQSSATALYIDDQTSDGVSLTTQWANLETTGFICLTQEDDSTKWQVWRWTTTTVDGTGYRKFTVSLIATSGSIANTKTVRATFSNDYSGVRTVSKSANYTTLLSDKAIIHPASDNNARTFTIDSNANVPYPVGWMLTFANEINTVTIAITSDTLTFAGPGTTGSRTLAANGLVTALKVDTTKWLISGVGIT